MQSGPGTITKANDPQKQREAYRKELEEIADDMKEGDADEQTASLELKTELEELKEETGPDELAALEDLLTANAPVFCKFGTTDDGYGFIVDGDAIDEAVESNEIVKIDSAEDIRQDKMDYEDAEFFGVFDPQGNLTELYDMDGDEVWAI